MVNSNTNKSPTKETLDGLLLYRKKDIVAIQKRLAGRKLDMLLLERSSNANKLVVPSDSKLIGKTLTDSYKLLLELVGDLITIQKNLNINGNLILAVEYEVHKDSTEISLGEIFNLLMTIWKRI